MRITTETLTTVLLRSINDASSHLTDVQSHVATSKRINSPSDDPTGLFLSLSLHSQVNEYQRGADAISYARGWLETSEQGLTQMQDQVLRARTLALNAGNGTLSEDELHALGAEVKQLLNAVVSAGNTQYQDQFVFGGYASLDAPFAMTTSGSGTETYAYTPHAGDIAVSLGRNTPFVVNSDLQSTFDLVANSLQGLGDDLAAGDSTGIQSKWLGQLDKALAALGDALADTGGKVRNLDLASDYVSTRLIQEQKTLSDTEDLDIAKASLEIAKAQTTYQAVLTLAAKALQPGLVAYLQ